MYFSLRVTSVCVQLLIATPITMIAGRNNTYEFGNDCPIFAKDIMEGDEIYVEYNGKDVASSCNEFIFRGRGEKILDEYSLCVTPLYFNDRECAIEVDILPTSFSEETTQKISCTETKRYKYCGPRDEKLSIVFKSAHGRSAKAASFRLLVTATKIQDEPVMIGALFVPFMMLIVGGLALMSCRNDKLCLCVCRRNLLKGKVLLLDPRNQTPGTAFVVYSGPPDLSKMKTTALVFPQGVYQVSSNPQPEQSTYTLATANNWTDAPPKYDDLTF